MSEQRDLEISVPEAKSSVGGILLRPPDARWLLVLAHGAGAGMQHPFMESLARELAGVGMATLRFNFPYMQQRAKRPDTPTVAMAAIRAAIATAVDAAPELPLLAGGKSFGGRMTSHLLSARDDGSRGLLSRVRGLVFFGFPLHAPNRPSDKRAAHLQEVRVPMLFLQGTRDTLADLSLLRPICHRLGDRATLHVIEEADHSFHVPKRAGKADEEVLTDLADTTAEWGKNL